METTGNPTERLKPRDHDRSGRAPARAYAKGGKVIAPTGKAFDVEFGQTTKWEGDRIVIIAAFWDAAALARQIGIEV
ncbi:MAG: hypothetical protein WB615_05930 [Candidatus Tumulicola sp.]